VRIELFGIVRARAGTDVVEVEAKNLGEAVRALAKKCPGLVPDVVLDGRLTGGFLISLNGERFIDDEAAAVGDGDTLLVLGAQAGG
jgi:molybdopterin converting factor small subunit